MSDYSGALEAVDRIVNRESEADEVLRQTVEVLHDRFDHYSWVGIYLVEEGDLVLGPWKGPRATDHVRIRIGKGVCGAAAASGQTEVVDDVNADRALETIKAYNKAVRTDVKFNPNVKDGRRTEGLAINKSNWANPVDEPPFEAYAVTCGITFTFGGLKIDTSGRVIDTDGQTIPGLHAAGELVGGLFYFNYPGGTGLMAGSVFGRIAGTTAGQRAAQMPS